MWLTSLVGTLVVYDVYRNLPPDLDAMARRRARASAVRTVGAVLWPSVLFALVPRDDRARPVLLVPLLFMAAAWLLDSQLLHTAPSDDADRPASLRLEPSALTSLTFGLCGLLGAKPDGRYQHLFLYAIVGCILLVLPSHNLHHDSVEAQLFESTQKSALLWCVGLLVAGIVLTRATPVEMGTPVA